MAQHAVLTKKSNQRIAAAVAVSGLVGTGFAVPFAQVALAVEPCTVTSDNTAASQATLRDEIDAAIADVDCDIVTINNITPGEPLELEVVGGAIYVGPNTSGPDPRNSITIQSTTGLNIKPSSGFLYTLMELQDSSSSSSYSFSFANSFETITIEGLTFRDSQNRAISGWGFGDDVGATLRVQNSSFIDNLDSYQGGAIATVANIQIINSIFVGNLAVNGYGGAVWTAGQAEISGSLFQDNEARDTIDNYLYGGGAVFAAGDLKSVNSTYLGNIADYWGGALHSGEDMLLGLNTFDNNSAGFYGQSAYGWSDIYFWGNVSSNLDGPEGFGSGIDTFDLGYNLFTSEDDLDVSADTSRVETRADLAFGDSPSADVLRAAPSAPVDKAPVLPITASSKAIGFVSGSRPSMFDSSFFNTQILVDQLGTLRGGSLDAGAHQLRYVPPVVRDRTNTQAPVVPVSSPKEALVPGFAANSIKLTNPMKKEIRVFLKANPNLKKVECKGYTSSPATAQDQALARKRGKAACDYIKTLRPDAKVTIRSGSHTNKPGSQIRRVSIKLS